MTEEPKFDFSAWAENMAFERDKQYLVNLIALRDFYDNLWAIALGNMFGVHRAITRDDVQAELDRLNPEGKTHTTENDLQDGKVNVSRRKKRK